ncbi:MAG: hypothetical protein Q7S68_03495 [Deltaproteobacteria bacterium]|nr:hypothetical protein [Deltaproteobacteria bacterium]
MKKSTLAVLVAGVIGLASVQAIACEEHAGKHKGKAEKFSMKHAEEKCTNWGMKAGSDEFKGCVKAQKQAMLERKEKRKEWHKKQLEKE